MRYSFRLAQLIGYTPDPRKRPGVIKQIVEYTGLDRHQVAALLKNDVKYVPFTALSRLCDFLIEHGYASADQLPGALFAIEPEHFWELLARRRRLELCLGVRRPREREWADGASLMASDSVLLGELLNGVSTLGGVAKLQEASGDGKAARQPHPEHLKQSLVWSPQQSTQEEVQARARQVYDDFASLGRDKALVCLGSIKSNPVAELVLASVFGCEPFQSQDGAPRADRRSCPFFLRYRDDDPQPPSASGGVQLSASEASAAPGFYYEQAGGHWECVEWRAGECDAALVFYVHREALGRLEMVLSGYSGRATRLLAKTLATRAEEFWPPVYQGQGMQIGAFLVQYTLDPNDDKSRNILRTDLTAATQVIRLPAEVIQRRLEPQHAALARPR